MPPPKRDQWPRPQSRRSPAGRQPSPPNPNANPTRSTAGLPTSMPPATAQPPRQSRQRSNRWMVWAFLLVTALGGVAGASAVSLLRIPNLPNCRAIFWPLASAATRLQCADAYADQGSVDSLLAAISLVEALPADHP
ncbi:MAG: hypothetical protein AAF283_03985, partial [Cyanobacteria bacterium P01_A01_bin.70]